MANIVGSDETSPQAYQGLTLDWKLTGEATAGALALVEAHGRPGTEPPLHYHESADEFFYIVDGELTFQVGEEVKRIGRSGRVWIPRGTIHGFAIDSPSATFLFGFVAAGLERMFIEASAAIRGGNEPPPASTSEAARSHRARHGTIVVGPPLRSGLAPDSDRSS